MSDLHHISVNKREILLFLIACSFLHSSYASTGAVAISGCPCLSACERTIDNPFTPWCYTSERPIPSTPENSELYCGKYSTSREAYWDECIIVNATGTATITELKTFRDIWWTTTVSTYVTVFTVFLLFLVLFMLLGPRQLTVWLPFLYVMFGGGQAIIGGAIISVIISFVYMSLPYAIDIQVSILLGISIGLIFSYVAVGTHRSRRHIEKVHITDFSV